MQIDWMDLHGETPADPQAEERERQERIAAQNAPDRYKFLEVNFQDNCMVAVYWDTLLEVYTSKGVNLEDLDFLGGFDSAQASIADAFREVK